MNRIWIISVLAIFCCAAVAQEAPRAEVFGGYQYFRANSGISGLNNFNLNGWNASASGFLNDYFGVKADFSGSYGTPSMAGIGLKTRLHTYMFGPVVRYHNASKLTPFAHALFGGGHISGEAFGISASESDFAWAAGGGVDVSVNNRFAVRVAQADFLQTRVGGDSQNNFRYSAGVVLRF
jgi:opacity protein-like surface antigen